MANDKYNKNPRMNRSRSTAVMGNQEHHDPSSARKNASGSPGTIDNIISNAATEQVLPASASIIRVANIDAATQFLFIGKTGDAPAGAPVLADGMALPAGHVENFFIGKLQDDESVFIKASSNNVQITVMED